jgi:NADP-dependent 3-hydroxy acid dehydrogenase YdfG
MSDPTALIVGAGAGLSAALARRLRREGYRVALAARSIETLRPLEEELELGARAFRCDAANAQGAVLTGAIPDSLIRRRNDAPVEPSVALLHPNSHP